MARTILRALARCAAIAAAIYVALRSGPRLFYPSLHGDESLYVGAAQRILAGDLFLTSFWLDKPPLTAYGLIPGMLIAGDHAVGYHLSGLLAAMAAVYMLVRWAQREGHDAGSAALLVSAAMVAPLMLSYHASAFVDPLLLCFLVLAIVSLAADRPKRAYHAFCLACLCKFSALMWAPIFVGYWLWRRQEGALRALAGGMREMLGVARPYIAVALLFMLTAREKLAPLAWFGHLLGQKGRTDKPGLWERAGLWVERLADSFASPAVVYLWATGLFALSAWAVWQAWHRRDDRARRALWLFVMPLLAHAIGLWLSGAALYARYLYLLLPQALLAFVVLVQLLPLPRIGHSVVLATCGVQLFFAGFSEPRRVIEVLDPPQWGRMMHELREEAPIGSVVHHNMRLWYLYPYMNGGDLRSSCADARCLEEESIARPASMPQYVIDEDAIALQRVGGATPRGAAPLSASERELLRKKLRLGSWARDLRFEGDELTVRVRADLPWVGGEQLSIRGTVRKSCGRAAHAAFGPGRCARGFVLRSLRVSGSPTEWVDLAPLVYGSYFLPLSPAKPALRRQPAQA